MALALVLHTRLDPASGNPVPGTDFPGAGSGPFDAARLEALLERLPYAKRLELERRDAAGRHASLVAITLVLAGARRLRGSVVGADALRFPAGGKPYCEGGPYFSVSHATSRVAVALSEDVDIGLDLEEIGQSLPEGGDQVGTLRRWTATEAVLKAAGLGLEDVRAVELEEGLAAGSVGGRRFLLCPIPIGNDVVAHLAAPRTITSLEVEALGGGCDGR